MIHRSANLRKTVGILVSAGVLMLMAAWLPLQSMSRSKDLASLKVAEKLDRVLQSRFQTTAGEFGMNRIMPAINGHESVRFVEASADKDVKEVLEEIANARREYLIAFLHTAHKPGAYVTHGSGGPTLFPQVGRTGRNGAAFKPGLNLLFMYDDVHHNLREPYRPIRVEGRADRAIRNLRANLEEVSLKELPKLTSGKKVDVTMDRWQVVMRPVLANQSSCLDCHKDAKQGDTLGVMVYAVGSMAHSKALARK